MDVDVVLYMKTPPDKAALEHLVSVLEDPVEDLVRKDSQFKKLELNPDDYVNNPSAVVDLLLQRKALLQRFWLAQLVPLSAGRKIASLISYRAR